ncbi:MAG: flavocytochrome c [Alkalispirochaeta sp.]
MKHIVGAISLILIGIFVLGGCSSRPEADVVIIGAGGAGLAAAVEAADAGASVIVLEKMPGVGGNTNYATGGMNAAGTEFQQDLGISDSPELFYDDTMSGGGNRNNPDLVALLSREAANSVSWLTTLGADLSDVGRLGGHSVNRTHRPTGGAAVGGHIVETLKAAADERGIDIRTWSEVTAVLHEDGEVTGVTVRDLQDEEDYDILAGAVVMAAGGFGANPEMLVANDPSLEGFGTTNHPGATGDAFDLVDQLDVALVDMEYIQTHPTVVPGEGKMITEAVRGNGAILVNRSGERFVNELDTRDVVSGAELEQDGGTALLVFDQGVRESLSAVESYINAGLVTEGDDVAALAEAIGAPAEQLEATIDRYNATVDEGSDSEFGRDSLPRQLNSGPYYAIEVGPAVHHTMGGIEIDTEARVLTSQGRTVPRFFAAGEATGGVHGTNRLGGNALADIITFGRIAGSNAAATASAE